MISSARIKIIFASPVVKNIFIYYVFNILSASLPFFLLKTLATYLTPSDFGHIALFLSYISGLSAFIGLNVIGALSRYSYKIDNRDLSEFIKSGFQILIVTLFIIIVLFYILFDFGIISPRYRILAYLAIVVSFSSFIVNLRLALWNAKNKAFNYSLMVLSIQVFIFIISYLFVVVFSYDFSGRVFAQVSTTFILSLFSIASLKKDGLIAKASWFNINKIHLLKLLNFGGALVPHVFGAFLISNMDRIFLSKKLGLAELGLYFTAVQLSLIFGLFLESINNAFVPWLFPKLEKGCESEKRRIVKLTYYWFIFLSIITLVLYFFLPGMIHIFLPKEFYPSSEILSVLIIGQFFSGLYLMVTNYIFFVEKTMALSIVSVGCGTLNIILLFFVVDRWGVMGAAWAFVLSMFVRFFATWVLSYKLFPMPWFGLRSWDKKSTLNPTSF